MSALGVWIIGIFGPLLAMKAGLAILGKTRDWLTIQAVARQFSPAASHDKTWERLRDTPALPISAAILGAWLAACAAGALAMSCAKFGGADAGYFWISGSRAACLAAAAAILYFPELKLCGGLALNRKFFLKAAAILVAAFAIFSPLISRGLALLPAAARFGWIFHQWRTIAGFAFLTHAFFLIDRARDCPDCEKSRNERWSNPKPWLLLGLLGLCGALADFPRAAFCAGLGAALGVVSIFSRRVFAFARVNQEA